MNRLSFNYTAWQVSRCKNKEQLDDILNRFTDTEKAGLLIKAMGSPKVSYCGFSNITDKIKVELLYEQFLTFAWKRFL